MTAGGRRACAAGLVAGIGLGTGSVALAASLTVASQHLGAATLAPPAFFPTSLVTAGAGGKVPAHTVAAGDSLTVAFSRAVSPLSLCSSWTNTKVSLTVTATINDNAAANGDDTLTLAATPGAGSSCNTAVHFGLVDLGSAGYVSGGSLGFPGSSLAMASSTRITVTLGTLKGRTTTGTGIAAPVSSGTPAVYAGGADANVVADTAVPADTVGLNSTAATVTLCF